MSKAEVIDQDTRQTAGAAREPKNKRRPFNGSEAVGKRPGVGQCCCFLLAFLAWSVGIAGAQVDIESLRLDGQRGFSGSAEMDLTLRAGNVELFEFGQEFSLSYGRDKDTFIFIGSGDAGWEGKERFSNEALGHVRYVRRIGPRLHWEVFGQTNYDKSRQLNFRALAGSGVRWAVPAPDSFWLGTSYMFEHEQNEVAAGARHAARTSVGRWSNYLSAAIDLGPTARLSGTAYVQPDLQQFDDYRILLDAALKVSITAALASTASVAFRHDSDPVEAVAKADFRLSTGLAVEW